MRRSGPVVLLVSCLLSALSLTAKAIPFDAKRVAAGGTGVMVRLSTEGAARDRITLPSVERFGTWFDALFRADHEAATEARIDAPVDFLEETDGHTPDAVLGLR